MKNKNIVVILLFIIIAGFVGTAYYLGVFDQSIEKVFNQNEVLEVSQDKQIENSDEILSNILENVKKIKSVRASVVQGNPDYFNPFRV